MKAATSVRFTLEIDEGLDEPLKVVRAVADGLRNIDNVLREWVQKARQRGCSWQQIADALNVTRQSAWERFGPNRDANDAIEAAFGAFADYPGPTTDEMRKIARLEEEEIEDRKAREGR